MKMRSTRFLIILNRARAPLYMSKSAEIRAGAKGPRRWTQEKVELQLFGVVVIHLSVQVPTASSSYGRWAGGVPAGRAVGGRSFPLANRLMRSDE